MRYGLLIQRTRLSERLHFNDARFDDTFAGQPVPNVSFSEMVDGILKRVDAKDMFAGKRAVVLGVPGAFTPVCTTRHIPEFLQNAASLREAGYSLLVCLAPDSPWSVQRRALDLDPNSSLRFLSDGNLAFARALGLDTRVEELFLGDCSKRYLITLNDAVIERVKVEDDVLQITRTSTNTLLVD